MKKNLDKKQLKKYINLSKTFQKEARKIFLKHGSRKEIFKRKKLRN